MCKRLLYRGRDFGIKQEKGFSMDHFELVSQYKPTFIIVRNKTLTAQVYSEFKAFFSYNAVEYIVS